MVWARYVVDQGGVDVGEDETVGANDGVGADIEGNVCLAMGVGNRNFGIQQLGSQARAYRLAQKRGRQVLMQEKEADQKIQLRFAVRGERNWCGFAAEEGLGNFRT